MLNDFIKLNSLDNNAFLAREAIAAIESVRTANTKVNKVVDILKHNFTDGGPIDWSRVEEILGLQAGEGEQFWGALNGARGAMSGEFQNSKTIELIDRFG